MRNRKVKVPPLIIENNSKIYLLISGGFIASQLREMSLISCHITIIFLVSSVDILKLCKYPEIINF